MISHLMGVWSFTWPVHGSYIIIAWSAKWVVHDSHVITAWQATWAMHDSHVISAPRTRRLNTERQIFSKVLQWAETSLCSRHCLPAFAQSGAWAVGLISGVISHMVQDDLGVCWCQSNIVLEVSNCSISVLCSKIEFHGKQNRGCIRIPVWQKAKRN